MARPTFTTVVALAACALAAGALVVAIGAEQEPAAPAPAAVDAPDGPVPLARRAEEAARADVAERARRAGQARTARSAESARRLTGRQGRSLAAAARRARTIVAPAPARLDPGDSTDLVARGPLRLRISCRRGARGGPDARIVASTTLEGALLEISGTPPRSLPRGRSVAVLRLTGERPVWLGGRAFTFAAPTGRAVNGVLSFGINRLGAACFASVAAFG